MMNNQDYQSLPPKRARTVKAAFTFKPRSGPRRIDDILKPLAKKIIITAYLEHVLSRERAASLIKSLGLGGRGDA